MNNNFAYVSSYSDDSLEKRSYMYLLQNFQRRSTDSEVSNQLSETTNISQQILPRLNI